MATLTSSRSSSLRTNTAEQFAPVLRVHADVQRAAEPVVDPDMTRRRIATGQVAYDALRVIASCGDLTPRFKQVLEALEVAGLLSNDERRTVSAREHDVEELISGWLTGDRIPRDSARRAARQAAIIVGNAVLRRASERVGSPTLWKGWARIVCPCCGGAPDMALIERGGHRSLVCSRCDAQWRAPRCGMASVATPPTYPLLRASRILLLVTTS